MPVKQISNNSWYLTESEAVVTVGAQIPFNNTDLEVGAVINETGENNVTARIRQWGKKNNMPQLREGLVNESNIVPALLGTKRDMILGAGLMAYKEVFAEGKREVQEVPMPQEIADWMAQSKFEDQLAMAARELMYHANVYTEFIMQRDGRKVHHINTHRCEEIRAEEKTDTNKVLNYYWSAGWGATKKEDYQKVIKKMPAYDPEKKQKQFVLHTYDDTCKTDNYYFCPSWWGGWQWIDLANTIPQFHRSNIQHGYLIRYHIEIPSDYFADNEINHLTPEDLSNKDDVQAEKKKKFIDGINEFLAGAKNAGRTVVTEYLTEMGKEYAGIKITPLSADLKDEALIKLFEASNQANISAQAIHPVLAAIETQGKLSSGNEIRNAFMMYLAIKAPGPRRILLKPLNLVAELNGWPKDIKIGFRDIQLTTLDESKTGTTEGAVGT